MAIDHPAKRELGVGGSAFTMADLLTQLGGRKERYLPALLCIAASLALHVLVGGASLLEPAASGGAASAASARVSEPAMDGELVELDQLDAEQVADSVPAGTDERAQGSAPPSEAVPAEPAKAEPVPAAATPPAQPPAPVAAPIVPEPPRPELDTEPRAEAPVRPAPTSRSTAISADPAAASARPRAAASATTPSEAASAVSPGAGRGGGDGPEGPGDGGGFERPRAPSAAARFTKELAAYAAPVVAWRELALGEAGALRLQIELDDEGRIVPLEQLCFAPVTTPEPLGESVRRSLRALRIPLAPPGRERAGSGRFELRIHASIDQVEVEATPGGDYRLESHYAGNRGHAAFVLESGRRVRFELELSSGELGACP
jgi:outer membrane biosynthesis protein TonB